MNTREDQVESMTEFTSLLLEYLVIKTGTTKLRAKDVHGQIFVTIGEKDYHGRTLTETFDQVLRDVSNATAPMRPEEIERRAKDQDEKDRVQAEEVLEELTKEGMSHQGRVIEDIRRTRNILIGEALIQTRATAPKDMIQLLEQTRRITGLNDLDMVELNHVLQSLFQNHTPSQDATATEILLGSNTKPN